MKVTVTGCDECPFLSSDDRNGEQCGCPRETVTRVELRMSWNGPLCRIYVKRGTCPLRAGPVTVGRAKHGGAS